MQSINRALDARPGIDRQGRATRERLIFQAALNAVPESERPAFMAKMLENVIQGGG